MSPGPQQKLPADRKVRRVRKRVKRQMKQKRRRRKGRRWKPVQVQPLQGADGL